MAILDYSTRLPARHFNRRLLLISSIVGAVAGGVLGKYTWEPLLRLLSRGTQIYFTELGEPFEISIRFAAVLALGGAIVGCNAALVAASWRRFLAGFIVSAGLFALGAAVGLVYARSEWNPIGIGFVPVASAPILTAPVVGCAAVLIALVVILAVRLATSTPRAITPPYQEKSPFPIPADLHPAQTAPGRSELG